MKILFPDRNVCSTEIIRNEEKDDKEICKGELGYHISTLVKSKPSDTIKFRLNQNSKGSIVAFYGVNDEPYKEIGTFQFSSNLVLSKNVVNNLHYLGKILKCEEMKPVKLLVVSIRNKDASGRSFLHPYETKFECSYKVNSKVDQNDIFLEVN